jgi:hypothetical protein
MALVDAQPAASQNATSPAATITKWRIPRTFTSLTVSYNIISHWRIGSSWSTTMMPTSREVLICSNFSAAHMREILEAHFERTGAPIRFEVRESQSETRAAEATAVVALVTAVSAAVGALITGLLQIAREGRAKKIVLQGKSGWRLELPADMPRDHVEFFLEAINRTDVDKVDLRL